ncbi:hypothetical protein L1987_19507 [Smallanthus sonchifolius]|uniref:Uncharacterized protein n=1 Tax=Smallanthus sonchifolius TaxID=185202 RepID=A0ACB9INS6_9ASTR|nr:hypothetical protein L1987_19507 [Smallanthus sonchifolius]
MPMMIIVETLIVIPITVSRHIFLDVLRRYLAMIREVTTVDKFQGQHNDFILLSLVTCKDSICRTPS